MTHYTRDQWGAAPSKGRTSLVPGQVKGIALHWPALSNPVRGVTNVKRALRDWQDYHQNGRGWSDIAYQGAVDQDGNTYELRGLKTRPAANGDTVPNQEYGALLLILAPGEQPTDKMVAAVRHEIARFREFFPGARQIVGHSQIRPEPTACPGPIALAAIKRGEFEPRKVIPPPKPAPPTRGKAIDEAYDAAMRATGGGKRMKLIRAARRALRAIPYLNRKK